MTRATLDPPAYNEYESSIFDRPIAAAPEPAERPATRPMSRIYDVLEWVGFACIIGCVYLIWPPAALGLSGVLLVVLANVYHARAEQGRGPSVGTKLSAAAAAYQRAGRPPG